MSLKNLLLAIPLIVAGVALSAITRAAEESGEIFCPPRLGTPIQSPVAATVPLPGSIAEAAAAFRKAITFDDVATVQQLLTLPNYVLIIEESTGNTPLHVAVSSCRANMVQLLLAHPGTNFNARDDYGHTPLQDAAKSCDGDVIDLLLAHPGADPNILFTTQKNAPMGSNEEMSLLHLAARHSNAAGAETLLVNGANLSPVTANGTTPLHFAATWNMIDVTDVLLRHGADPNAHDYDEGRTPLHAAVIWNGLEKQHVTFLLLAHAETDPGAEDDLGLTPLHWAAKHDTVNIVEVLLDQGVDPNSRADNGQTPLHLAAFQDDPDVVEVLLDHGADPMILSDTGWYPLTLARHFDHYDLAEVLEPVSDLG